MIAANKAFINGLKVNGGFLIKPGENVLPPEHFPDDYLQYWKGFYDKALSGEKVQTEVYIPQVGSAESLWFELEINPIKVDDIITGIACSMRDITERKKAAEVNIKESEEKYRTTVHRISDAFTSLDNNLCYTYMNDKCGELLGTDPDKIIGKHIYTAFPEVIGSPFHKAFETAIREQKYMSQEEYYAPYDKWFESRIYPSENGISIYFTDITERIKANEFVKESEEKYRTLAETSPDYIMRYDKAGRHTYMNKAALDISGMKPSDIIGKTHLEAGFDPEQSAFWEEKINYVFETGEIVKEQFSWESAKGTIHLDWRLSPEFDDQRKVKSVLGISRDITYIKTAEQSIKESEERLRDLFDNITDIICTHEVDGNVLSMNRAAENVIGFKILDDKKLNIKDILIPERRHEYDDYIKEIVKVGYAKGFMQIVTSTGEHRIWEFSNTLKNRESNEPVVRGYSRDITEKIKVDRIIKESEEKFRTLVQQAADGIFIADLEGNYLEVNESMAKLTGYSIDELKQMNGRQIVEAEDLKKQPLKLEEIKTGNPVFIERVIRKKDGTLRNVEISARLMDNGKVISIMRDITDRKKVEEKIKQLNNELEQKVKERTAELEETNKDLEEVNELFVGNEIKILELKEELEKLKKDKG